MDRKRPPTFSVDGLRDDMEFSGFAVKIDSAREARPCTEQRNAKKPGHLTARAVCLAERTYSRQESIEVRPCYQGIILCQSLRLFVLT